MRCTVIVEVVASQDALRLIWGSTPAFWGADQASGSSSPRQILGRSTDLDAVEFLTFATSARSFSV